MKSFEASHASVKVMVSVLAMNDGDEALEERLVEDPIHEQDHHSQQSHH